MAIAAGLIRLAEILAMTDQLEAAEVELAHAAPVVTRLGSDSERARASFVAAVVHHRAGRSEKLRYIYLTPDEEQQLRELEAAGVEVTAQDVPSARAVPLPEVLQGAAR